MHQELEQLAQLGHVLNMRSGLDEPTISHQN